MGSLLEGAAAVSVGVGLGTEVGVPSVTAGVSVLVPAVPEGSVPFLRLKTILVSEHCLCAPMLALTSLEFVHCVQSCAKSSAGDFASKVQNLVKKSKTHTNAGHLVRLIR